MANMQRLEAALTRIMDHPDKHNQEVWITLPKADAESLNDPQHKPEELIPIECGTAGCLAGHAVLMFQKEIPNFEGFMWEMGENGKGQWTWYLNDVTINGYTYNIGDVARMVFDISGDEAGILFSPYNTLEQLQTMVKAIGNGEDITDENWQIENVGWIVDPY